MQESEDQPGAKPGAPAPAEGVGNLVKQFALYPFFIVLGVVAVFTLFSLLLKDKKTEIDYLREIRTARGDERWYAAFQLSNVLSREGDKLRHDPAFLNEVTVVFEASEGEDPRLQRYLCIVLGWVGDGTSEPVLVRTLAQDDDAETRVWSAWALGKIASPGAVPALVTALADSEAAVRKMSAYALGSLKDSRAALPLVELLEDPIEDVRWNAAIALALQGRGEGYRILQQMVNALYLTRIDGMTDERLKDVMLNAVKALGVLQGTFPSARDLLQETSESAPFPMVQHEAREQLARSPAPGG